MSRWKLRLETEGMDSTIEFVADQAEIKKWFFRLFDLIGEEQVKQIVEEGPGS